MSRFLTCTDGISQAARLSGRICDRDESMTLLRSAPAQSPHGRTPGDRIQPVSARHLLWRPRQPIASRLLRNTRRIEPRCFRFADDRSDRSGLSTAENSYRKVASTRTSDHLATFGAGNDHSCPPKLLLRTAQPLPGTASRKFGAVHYARERQCGYDSHWHRWPFETLLTPPRANRPIQFGNGRLPSPFTLRYAPPRLDTHV